MDARIVAEVVVIQLTVSPMAKVVTTIKVDELVLALVSLFDHATILAPLLSQQNSISAVAPGMTNSEREVSALAVMV